MPTTQDGGFQPAPMEWRSRTMLTQRYVTYLQDAGSVHHSNDADVFAAVQRLLDGGKLIQRKDGSMYVPTRRRPMTLTRQLYNVDDLWKTDDADVIIEITSTL